MDEKNRIIDELARNGTIQEIINNMSIKQNDKDDLEQEIYMILLEYDEEKIIELYNKKQLKWFIIKVIKNQYYSKNSPYYAKYKKYYQYVDSEEIKNNEQEFFTIDEQ